MTAMLRWCLIRTAVALVFVAAAMGCYLAGWFAGAAILAAPAALYTEWAVQNWVRWNRERPRG